MMFYPNMDKHPYGLQSATTGTRDSIRTLQVQIVPSLAVESLNRLVITTSYCNGKIQKRMRVLKKPVWKNKTQTLGIQQLNDCVYVKP